MGFTYYVTGYGNVLLRRNTETLQVNRLDGKEWVPVDYDGAMRIYEPDVRDVTEAEAAEIAEHAGASL